MKNVYLILVLCGTYACASKPPLDLEFGSITIEYKKNSDFKLLQGVEAGLKVQGEVLGFLKYIKIPFTRVIIFYDFYVKPAWRRKKIGTTLSGEVMKKALYEERASYIIIQPGPFELSSAGSSMSQISHEEHRKRLDELVTMYSKHGFRVYTNVVLTPLLRFTYSMIGIDEDPSFLMIGDESTLKKHYRQ